MWEDYSFPVAPQCSTTDHNSSVTIENPSDSSPGASPLSDDDLTAPWSITELSQHFQLHSLQAHPLSFPTRSGNNPLQSLHPLSQHERLTTTAHFNQRRKQRQTLTRRQCSSANLSRLSSLAQDLATLGCDASSTPLSDTNGSLPPLQIHQRPASVSSYNKTTSLSNSDSEYCTSEPQTPTTSRPQFKVGKCLTHSVSKESLARQRLVYKDVRIRTKRQPSLAAS